MVKGKGGESLQAPNRPWGWEGAQPRRGCLHWSQFQCPAASLCHEVLECAQKGCEEAHMEASQKPVTWMNWPSHLGGVEGRAQKSLSPQTSCSQNQHRAIAREPRLWLQLLQQQEDSPPGGGPGL